MMQADDDPAAVTTTTTARPPAPYQQQQQHQPQPPHHQHQQQHQQQQQPNQRPTPPSSSSPSSPYSLYDVFLDVPHPGCSGGGVPNNSPGGAVVIYPPRCRDPNSNSSSSGDDGDNNRFFDGGGIVDCPSSSSSSSLLSEFGGIGGIARVSRFAFPEYDDEYENNNNASASASASAAGGGPPGGGGRLNRHDVYLEDAYRPPPPPDDIISSTTTSTSTSASTSNSSSSSSLQQQHHQRRSWTLRLPSCHTFSHRLPDGTVLHGHVRRYLPSLPSPPPSSSEEDAGGGGGGGNVASSSSSSSSSSMPRRDVGRRSPRALVLLTRHSGGGGRTYGTMLRIAEAIGALDRTNYNTVVVVGSSGSGDDDDDEGNDRGKLLRRFLHSAYREHVNLCRGTKDALARRASTSTTTTSSGPSPLSAPKIMTLPLVELGPRGSIFGGLDDVRIVVPSYYLHGDNRGGGMMSTSTSTTNNDDDVAGLCRNDLLPMLRCLGPTRAMRLLSAMMSGRRVILTCREDAGKLSAVAYGAASMVGQGMLMMGGGGGGGGGGRGTTLFVPVLPPGLRRLLHSPSAYLIGVLLGGEGGVGVGGVGVGGSADRSGPLRRILDGIAGEVVVFDIDSPPGSSSSFADPYFNGVSDPRTCVPDISQQQQQQRRGVGNVDDHLFDAMSSSGMQYERSIADDLHRDLTDCLRSDRRLFYQGAVQEKLGMAATRTKTAAVGAMKKGMKFLKAKSSMMGFDLAGGGGGEGGGVDGGEDDPDEEGDVVDGGGGGGGSRSVGRGNYAYEGGYPNEKSEEDARIAFATFFVCLYGDVASYLTRPSPGMPPVPDGQKFARCRAANGDVQGSGMFLLVGNFLRSGLFEPFAEARRDEVMTRRAVPEDAPLFVLAIDRHRANGIDFAPNSVRNSVRQIATRADFPGRYLIDWHVKVRDRVSQLTSAQAGGGDFARDASQLAEDCRESGAVLVDAMMVLWTRMQEGRGMQWKKAHLALQVLRGLLLNGPIAAITEAMDGYASIRILKSYTETLRGQNARLVRDVAAEIHSLLVNTPVLFARRRECMNARRLARDPRPSPLVKETRMIGGINTFRKVHLALRPTGAAVAPAPMAPVEDLLVRGAAPVVVHASATNNRENAPSGAARPGGYSDDLLSLSVFAAAASQPPATSGNNTGVDGHQLLPSGGPQVGNYSNDLLALNFGAFSLSQAAAASNEGSGRGNALVDPFSMPKMSQATQINERQQPAGESQSGNNPNDPLALSFGASSLSQVVASSNAGSGGGKELVDPFSMYQMSQATPRMGPPTANIHPSHPTPSRTSPSTSILPAAGNTYVTAPQPPFQAMMNGPVMTHNVHLQPPPSTQPFAMTNIATPFPMQPAQHSQSLMNHSLMPIQTRSSPPKNSPLSMTNNMQVPQSQQMQQQSQIGSTVSNPMSIPPQQGWNLPVNYHQPQQSWTNAAPALAPSGFQTNQPMPVQNSAPVISNGVPPVMQGAPQFLQGAFAPQNPPM